jgi:hypothetical protein
MTVNKVIIPQWWLTPFDAVPGTVPGTNKGGEYV